MRAAFVCRKSRSPRCRTQANSARAARANDVVRASCNTASDPPATLARAWRQSGWLFESVSLGSVSHGTGDPRGSSSIAEGARLKTRFDHGRIYGSSQTRWASTAAKALLLPAVLTARTLRQPGRGGLSASTLGWLALQHTAWAAGEFTGASVIAVLTEAQPNAIQCLTPQGVTRASGTDTLQILSL